MFKLEMVLETDDLTPDIVISIDWYFRNHVGGRRQYSYIRTVDWRADAEGIGALIQHLLDNEIEEILIHYIW